MRRRLGRLFGWLSRLLFGTGERFRWELAIGAVPASVVGLVLAAVATVSPAIGVVTGVVGASSAWVYGRDRTGLFAALPVSIALASPTLLESYRSLSPDGWDGSTTWMGLPAWAWAIVIACGLGTIAYLAGARAARSGEPSPSADPET